MGRFITIFIAFFLICFLDCTIGSAIEDGEKIITNKNLKGTSVQFTFTRGSAWGNKVNLGSVTFHIKPQIALWIADSTGKLLQNIYITNCFAKQQWSSFIVHPDSTYCTMSLPFWLNKMKHASLPIPTKANPLPDAVTAATPAGSFTIQTHIDSTIKHGVVWCEINSSFDNNERYSTDHSDSFNGQPSILFSGEYAIFDSSRAPVELKYCGHGGESGDDGALYQNDSGITSAKQILASIQFIIAK